MWTITVGIKQPLLLLSSWLLTASVVSSRATGQVSAFSFVPLPLSHRRPRFQGSHRTTDRFSQQHGRTMIPSSDSTQVCHNTALGATTRKKRFEETDGRKYKQKQHADASQQPPTKSESTTDEAQQQQQQRRGKLGAGSDSYLLSVHKSRLQRAGRVGTKRFVDPCKVFCGNLPFDCTEEQLRRFFQQHLSHSAHEIHDIQMVKDWKTNQSKGYAFCRFTDPIFATVAMDKCSGKELGGRPIVVRQGKKKDQDQAIHVKKNKKTPQDSEEAAIQQGLVEAEAEAETDEGDGTTTEWILLDDHEENDDILFADDEEFQVSDDDDDDDDFDGVFEEIYPLVVEEPDMTLNREQRRNSTRAKKRRKLPNKGFGGKPSARDADF